LAVHCLCSAIPALMLCCHGRCRYFCNPLSLMLGEVCCSPYRDKEQTDSRTSLLHLGYPYNFEPLNFFRGATSLVCASWAGFQILAYRGHFLDERKALRDWLVLALAIGVMYAAMMVMRWRVFCRHSRAGVQQEKSARQAMQKESKQPMAAEARP
jgi:hypothetical protein